MKIHFQSNQKSHTFNPNPYFLIGWWSGCDFWSIISGVVWTFLRKVGIRVIFFFSKWISVLSSFTMCISRVYLILHVVIREEKGNRWHSAVDIQCVLLKKKWTEPFFIENLVLNIFYQASFSKKSKTYEDNTQKLWFCRHLNPAALFSKEPREETFSMLFLGPYLINSMNIVEIHFFLIPHFTGLFVKRWFFIQGV